MLGKTRGSRLKEASRGVCACVIVSACASQHTGVHTCGCVQTNVCVYEDNMYVSLRVRVCVSACLCRRVRLCVNGYICVYLCARAAVFLRCGFQSLPFAMLN